MRWEITHLADSEVSTQSRSSSAAPSAATGAASRDFVIETHPAVGAKIVARQMQEYRAAATGDARGAVVIDLDDEIVEMVVAREPVAGLVAVSRIGWL